MTALLLSTNQLTILFNSVEFEWDFLCNRPLIVDINNNNACPSTYSSTMWMRYRFYSSTFLVFFKIWALTLGTQGTEGQYKYNNQKSNSHIICKTRHYGQWFRAMLISNWACSWFYIFDLFIYLIRHLCIIIYGSLRYISTNISHRKQNVIKLVSIPRF